jgi:hypothetical protein
LCVRARVRLSSPPPLYVLVRLLAKITTSGEWFHVLSPFPPYLPRSLPPALRACQTRDDARMQHTHAHTKSYPCAALCVCAAPPGRSGFGLRLSPQTREVLRRRLLAYSVDLRIQDFLFFLHEVKIGQNCFFCTNLFLATLKPSRRSFQVVF